MSITISDLKTLALIEPYNGRVNCALIPVSLKRDFQLYMRGQRMAVVDECLCAFEDDFERWREQLLAKDYEEIKVGESRGKLDVGLLDVG